MAITIIEAEIKKTNYYSDGYIIIDGNTVEGIFTLDYVKIFNKENRLRMFLSETTFSNTLIPFIKKSCYTFSDSDTSLYAPERYTLFNKLENLELHLFSIVRDKEKISSIEDSLARIRRP